MSSTVDLPASAAAPSPAAGRAHLALLVGSALAVPIAWISVDLVERRTLLPYLSPILQVTYAIGAALSLLGWGLGMEAARHPRRSARFAALGYLAITAAFGIGGQRFFREMTNGYVNRDALMLALATRGVVAGFVSAHAARLAAFFAIPALVVTALALARARIFGLRARRPTAFAGAALATVLVSTFAPLAAHWYQCLPPDILWIHGTGGPILYALGLADRPKTLPAGEHEGFAAVAPVGPDAPSIVVLFGESVRADEVCAARSPGCTRSPRLDEAAPDRVGFAHAYSVASCTEVASAALWTGLPITEGLAGLAHAPLIWDYARARGYRTAYLASQNLLFQHLGMFVQSSRIDLLREARDREANPSIDVGSPDEQTTAEAAAFVEEGGPSLVLVHFANTHQPYRQTPGFTPYPVEGQPAPEAQRNLYRNAVFYNDVVIGDFLKRLRAGARGRRAIVISLSDHGEAWGNHRSFAHSFDLYGEQIDVPLWIDAPAGALPEEALARLRRGAPSRPASTVDVTATVLDLLGALDEPAFQAPTARLAGESLLRDATAGRDVLLWNCPPTRECALLAFGVVRWPRKLHYVGREARYACHDLGVDPGEDVELPAARCADLRGLLDHTFGPHTDIRAREAPAAAP